MFSDKDTDDLISRLSTDNFPGVAGSSGVGEMLEEICLCTFIADPVDRRFLFSQGMVELIGKEASQDMLLDAFAQYIRLSERESAVEQYVDGFDSLLHGKGKIISFEHSIMRSADETNWVRVFMQLGESEGEKCIFGAVLDKTKSMSERILSQLFSDGISEFVFYYDSVTDICYINSYMMQSLDLKHHYIENAAKEIIQMIHPDDHANFVGAMENFLQKRSEQLSGEFRFLSPTRGEIWVHACGASDYDITGSMRYITGLFIDITDRKKSESLHRNIIEGTSAIVFTADINRNEITFSENLCQIFPDAPLEIRGGLVDVISEHIIPEDRKRFRDPIEHMLVGDTERYSVEFRINRGGKTIWLASRGKAFFDSS